MTRCLALLCDRHGIVDRVLRNDLPLINIRANEALVTFCDHDSVSKVQQFLKEIRSRHATFNWEINIAIDDEMTSLRFAGGMIHDHILVVGVPSSEMLEESFYAEMMRINNEQLNQMRTLLKEQALQMRRVDHNDHQLIEEFSKLNNELVNTRRELEKKNIELAAQRERYRLVSELVSDFAYALDVALDGSLTVAWFTEAFTRITGFEEVNSYADWYASIHPEDRHIVDSAWEKLLDGETCTSEYRIITRYETVCWLRDYSRPVYDSSGHIRHIYGAAQDITADKTAQEQIEKLRLEKERMQVLSRFMQDASHEFHTPLSIIQSSLYLIGRGGVSDRQQYHIDKIGAQADRITTLLDTMITMVCLDGSPPEEKKQINLSMDLQQWVEHNEAAIQAAGLALSVDIASNVFLEIAQRDLMQALQCVMDNAIRYTPDGGRITVTLSCHESVVIEISDTGIGIPPENQPHIFDRFFRHDVAHTTPGFGLGLSIAQRVVQNHNGKIAVESQPGVGSTFRIILPV